jgi:hypothetical protein
MTYQITNEPGTTLYGIAADGGLLYEPDFTETEARRLLECLQVDDELTWQQCADYVEGRTEIKPLPVFGGDAI